MVNVELSVDEAIGRMDLNTIRVVEVIFFSFLESYVHLLNRERQTPTKDLKYNVHTVCGFLLHYILVNTVGRLRALPVSKIACNR